MYNFAERAKKKTTAPAIMDGKAQIKTDDLIRAYPNGVTVTGFDMLNGDDNEFAVLTYGEDSTKFFYGGCVMTKVVNSWIADFDGDIDVACDALRQSGGVKVKFEHAKTRKGNNITRVSIV